MQCFTIFFLRDAQVQMVVIKRLHWNQIESRLHCSRLQALKQISLFAITIQYKLLTDQTDFITIQSLLFNFRHQLAH